MFKETLQRLVTAFEASAAAKQRWLDLQSAGSDEQFEARRLFIQADEASYACSQQFTIELTALRGMGMVEATIDGLGELATPFYRMVSTLRLDGLLVQWRPDGLAELVPAWRNAAGMLDAAQRINQIRCSVAASEFEKALPDSNETRNPKAWEKAVSVLRLFQADPRWQDATEDDRLAEATLATVRHTRKVLDQLTEQLQTVVEDLVDHNALSGELEELELMDRRALISAIDGGLCRQRQTQTQTKPQTRPVTTIETEAETDASPDSL